MGRAPESRCLRRCLGRWQCAGIATLRDRGGRAAPGGGIATCSDGARSRRRCEDLATRRLLAAPRARSRRRHVESGGSSRRTSTCRLRRLRRMIRAPFRHVGLLLLNSCGLNRRHALPGRRLRCTFVTQRIRPDGTSILSTGLHVHRFASSVCFCQRNGWSVQVRLRVKACTIIPKKQSESQ